MNKRGKVSEILFSNVVYILLLLVFFLSILYYVLAFEDGAARWEDFYAKEIAKIIDTVEPGTEVWLDVTKGTEIAVGRAKDPKKIVNFDNVNQEVLVSLRPSGGTSFGFFKDVDVIDWRVELVSGSADTNRLFFKVIEKQRENE